MEIISQLFDVLLKKRAPEDVSYSINAMIVACLATVLAQYFLLSLVVEFSQPLLYSVVLTSSQIMAYALLLKLQNKENRLVQCITTLFGINFIILIMALTLATIPIISIFSLVLLIYGITLSIQVLKSSFSCPTYLAIVIFVSIKIFSSSTLSIVAPDSSGEIELLLKNFEAAVAAQQKAS